MADKMVKLLDISARVDCQIRGGLNSSQVAELRDLLDGGVDLDPVDLFINPDEGEGYIMSDGFHRKAAYAQSGREKIPAVIHEGGLSEALEYAMKNCRHGNPMTNAGKRSAVKMALADIRIKRMSDKRISRMCGVSATLVADVRSGKAEKAAKERKAREVKAEPVQRYEPAPVPPKSSGGSGQALAPVVAHERPAASEPTKVETLDEKMKAIEGWIKAGYVDLPAIVSCSATKTHRLIMIPKKNLCFVIADEGQPLREYKVEKLDMVNGKIQVELTEGEAL